MGEAKRRKAAGTYSTAISRVLAERERRYDYNTCEFVLFIGFDNHFLKIEFMGRKFRDKLFSRISENEFISMRVMMAPRHFELMKNLHGETPDWEMKSLTVVILSNDAVVKRLSLGDIPNDIIRHIDESIQSEEAFFKDTIKAKRLEEVCGENLLKSEILWMENGKFVWLRGSAQ